MFVLRLSLSSPHLCPRNARRRRRCCPHGLPVCGYPPPTNGNQTAAVDVTRAPAAAVQRTTTADNIDVPGQAMWRRKK